MADIRELDAVLEAPGVHGLLDFSRPIALLMVAVLHFVPDEDGPAALVEHYRTRLAPGSLLVLSHVTADHDASEAAATSDVYRGTANLFILRRRDQVAALFDGTELVDPGLVDATEWRPDGNVEGQHRGIWAGVGRIL
jgi:hypothetical protein